MAALIGGDKENGGRAQLRHRLQSAPGSPRSRRLHSSKCPKAPFSKKLQMGAPLQSGRKAFGAVNKIFSTPSVSGQKALAVQSQAEVKANAQSGVEYPETEKFIPYNPLDFESFEVPEEIRLSHLCLAGLGSFPLPRDLSEDGLDVPDIHVEMSPLKSTSGLSTELNSFLQAINELIVDMPPEMDC